MLFDLVVNYYVSWTIMYFWLLLDLVANYYVSWSTMYFLLDLVVWTTPQVEVLRVMNYYVSWSTLCICCLHSCLLAINPATHHHTTLCAYAIFTVLCLPKISLSPSATPNSEALQYTVWRLQARRSTSLYLAAVFVALWIALPRRARLQARRCTAWCGA